MNPWHIIGFPSKKNTKHQGTKRSDEAPAPPRSGKAASSLVENPNARCEFGGRLPLGRAFCEVRRKPGAWSAPVEFLFGKCLVNGL